MLISRFKSIFSGEYIRNAGWLTLAEFGNRIFRLLTTVTLARMFSQEDYGYMAIIFTVCDFSNVFTLRGGIGAKLIQAEKEDLPVLCRTVYWLNWMICIALFLAQCIAALLISHLNGNRQLFFLLVTASTSYLLLPFYLVPLTLIERENRLKVSALANTITSFVSNSLTVVMALLGFGAWAIAIPLLLATPLWIFFSWKYHSWRPPLRFSAERWKEVLGFGKNILLIEILNRFRANVDYLLVGRFLGVEALGLYYFAFNAGSGITINLVNSFMTALFPYVCAARENYEQFKHRYFSGLKKALAFMVPTILLQAALAPIYVPIVFGEKWREGIPILILICLSVIPRIYGWSSGLLLNSIDRTQLSLLINAVFTVVFSLGILLVVQNGVLWVAAFVFASHYIIQMPIALGVHHFVFSKHRFSKSFK